MSARYGLLLCAQLLAALVFVVLSRAESGRPNGTREVPCKAPLSPKKLTIVFVDSLSSRVAQDARVMPELAALARRGVSFEVSPCRDQLTYLCLRALLSGYDESSLLALYGNFNHEPSAGDNLLERLAQAGRRVVLVGSHDFEPYRSALYRTRLGDGSLLSESRSVSDLDAIDPGRAADVTIISLSNGDRTAHEFGTGRPEYALAFRAIDETIGRAVARLGADSDVLVFGDHGHDEMGRHLPGLPSTTYAVYAGPSFRKNVQLRARLTDHRAILGVLLGVPTPPSYTGPPLERIFEPSPERSASFSELRAPPASPGSNGARWLLAGLALPCAIGIAVSALRLTGLDGRWCWALAVLGAASMAAAGAGYDAVRQHIHDHGSEPMRSLWLLVPLVLGFGFAAARRPGVRAFARTTLRGALSTVLLSFSLLFPTAYYYGATRATLLAAIVALWVTLFSRVRSLSLPHRAAAAGLVSAMTGLLWSLSGLHDVGGRTREMAYFVLSSPLFERYAWFTLCIAKLGLWLGFAFARSRSRRDLSLALALSLLSLALAHWPALGSRYWMVGSGVAYLALHGWRSRYLASRTSLGLLTVGQLYGEEGVHVAPLHVLLLCVALSLAYFRLLLADDPRARAAASGTMLAIAAYLMLWPTLGMRFSGIDFRFMFAWVPSARYEELWWLIGLGMLIKFVWPYALLVDLARRSSPPRALASLYFTLSLKLAALSAFAAWYATSHSLLSNGALEVLAELALLLVVSVLSWPSPVRALHPLLSRLGRRVRSAAVLGLLPRSR